MYSPYIDHVGSVLDNWKRTVTQGLSGSEPSIVVQTIEELVPIMHERIPEHIARAKWTKNTPYFSHHFRPAGKELKRDFLEWHYHDQEKNVTDAAIATEMNNHPASSRFVYIRESQRVGLILNGLGMHEKGNHQRKSIKYDIIREIEELAQKQVKKEHRAIVQNNMRRIMRTVISLERKQAREEAIESASPANILNAYVLLPYNMALYAFDHDYLLHAVSTRSTETNEVIAQAIGTTPGNLRRFLSSNKISMQDVRRAQAA